MESHLLIQKPSAQHKRLCVESAPRKDIFKQCATQEKLWEQSTGRVRNDIFLGTVNVSADTVSSIGSLWVINLTLNGHPLQFKIDTGADVTVIGETDYSSRTTLSSPSQMPPELLGKFQANLREDGRETQDDVFVIKGP